MCARRYRTIFWLAADLPTQDLALVRACSAVTLSSLEDCHNTETDVCSMCVPMPTAIFNHSVCVMFRPIYVLRGEIAPGEMDSSVYRFDPAADDWSSFSFMRSLRTGLVSFVLDGYLHAALVRLLQSAAMLPRTDG